ncbi:peptidase family M41-domain-containing protein [Baffinella frigidus]|nr:peptidase family M41-domain-containing protein [Cryptophyta sp. CCMP2293]
MQRGVGFGISEGLRGFFGRISSQKQLQALEREADAHPRDGDKQAELLRVLNTLDPDAVIRRCDSRQFASNDNVAKEYIKALVHLGRLDRTRLSDLTRVSSSGPMPQQGAAQRLADDYQASRAVGGGQASWGGLSAAGGAQAPGHVMRMPNAGSTGDPIRISMTEPSVWQQFWKTFRALATAYLLFLGISTIMEERGLSRGGGTASSVTQATESTKTFEDVVGVDEAKGELMEIVDFLRNPEKFTRLGGKMTKGVLLMGPPGTGKTLLAKAIAGEAGVPFFYASGSEFEEMYVGVGARRVRDLFDSAKRKAPCIIFIDEIDAIGATRNPKDQQYMRMTLNQLLADMDGFVSSEGIVVIAATNFPEVLDKALTRPGRFDRHVHVPNPDVKGRSQILNLHMRAVPKGPDVDINIVARGTPGFSGADLANVVNIAAIKASQDNKKAISMADLEYAKDRIMMGAERKSAVITEASRKLTAYHEGGHALVACYTEGALAVHKATVVPRGMALGMVMQLPDKDETSWSKKQMLARMDVAMGGRVAEELIFGAENVTSGASSDFEQATNIAIQMVERWGMSDRVGFVAHRHLTGKGFDAAISEDTRKVPSQPPRAYSRAVKVLKTREKELHLLAAQLIEKETLTGDEVHPRNPKSETLTSKS